MSTGCGTVLVEVKRWVGVKEGGRYENGRSTEKVELMRTHTEVFGSCFLHESFYTKTRYLQIQIYNFIISA